MATDNYSVGDFVAPAFEAHSNAGDSLFNRVLDTSTNAVSSLFEHKDEFININMNGFPQIDLTGFDQEVTYKSEGVIGDIWHGIKHMFSKDATLEDKLREKAEKDMSPDERKQFEKENKDLAEYHRKLIHWETLATINPPPMPMPPDTPMHKEIEKRVEKMEKEIEDYVKSKMSPQDRERLDKQLKKFEDESAQARRILNPFGTGEGFRRPPEPGNAMKDYWDRVKEETERRLNK